MKDAKDNKFGTFGGVFTPCVLTILGVIMFLRYSHVVGQAGLWHAMIIVLCAKLITVLTAFSLSAISTNIRVKGGGAYFLISRSLGVEFGGVIGIVFFIAQAVSVSMYVVGFTEAFVATFAAFDLSPLAIATIVNFLTFACVYVGAGWTIKLQYGILAVLGVSILAFVVGALPLFDTATLLANMRPAYLQGDSAFSMFALFFPAVTGIMAGANMSGDLRDPGRSIPAGTLAAIAVTAVIYLLMAVLFAGAASRKALIDDPQVVSEIAVSSVLIAAGIFAATLSSALGSMMGAPRILQAFARDDIFPSIRYFAKGSGGSAEPRRATVLTFLIAQCGVMLGDLNAIAPVITMFFMITYGLLNLACFYEGITGNPSYRPRFRYSHWSLSLLGAVSCGVVMLLVNFFAALASIAMMVLLYQLISRAEIISRWGDVSSGVAFERARRALLKLEEGYFHPKNWRPAILALSGAAWSRFHLAEYSYWLSSGRGIVTLAQIIPDVGENRIERRAQALKRLRRFIRDEDLQAFPAVVIENSLAAGANTLLQAHGIGGMRPNTVLFGMAYDEERWSEFCETLRLARRYERSIVVVDCNEDAERWVAPQGSIDVLWRGHGHGELTVLLAHLLASNPEWRGRPFRLLAVLPPKGDADNLRAELTGMLELARIDATVHVFGGEDLYVTLARRVGNSAVLFLPIDVPEPHQEQAYRELMLKYAKLVPDLIYVYSAQDVSLEA